MRAVSKPRVNHNEAKGHDGGHFSSYAITQCIPYRRNENKPTAQYRISIWLTMTTELLISNSTTAIAESHRCSRQEEKSKHKRN